MKHKRFILIIVFFVSSLTIFSQRIIVEADNEPLNRVFIRLRDNYGLQFSFDDQLLSEYRVTLSKDFISPEEALKYLLSGLPLSYEKRGEVFLIFHSPHKETKKEYLLSGHVVDSKDNESLPFANVLINEQGVMSDFNGKFSYISTTDSVFHLQISYLGYYILDTTVHAGMHKKFMLTPSVIGLQEVMVTSERVEKTTQIGDKPGIMRVNHKVAGYLPGNGDNSVFHLLRLQPGILAAGEQSNDIIIWGSYEGHSQVLFDGFTVFGLKNFNDNISVVNPFMAKDIKVMKGGYGANYGDRVGGIIDISGIHGNHEKPSLNLSINNMTVNSVAGIPVFKTSSLVMAFRQTYYNLYSFDDMDFLNRDENHEKALVDINVSPDYVFRDVNVKYSGFIPSGDIYYISYYRGGDDFSYLLEQQKNLKDIVQQKEEQNRQQGASGFYGKEWKNGNSTNVSVSYSGLETTVNDIVEDTRPNRPTPITRRNENTRNKIEELNSKIENTILVSQKHILETGIGFIHNDIELREDSFDIEQSNQRVSSWRVNGYVLDNISVSRSINFNAGFRINYPLSIGKVYFQPRLAATFKIGNMWKVNAAWGMYNQFIVQSSMVDELGNYQYFWTSFNNEDIPVLQSQHYVTGLSFNIDDLIVSVEGYFKTVEGLTRFIYLRNRNTKDIYQGEGRSYGVDFFIKKDISRHSAWISYTLSKTEEYFYYFPAEFYVRAPQDQRHEVKLAGLVNVSPFYFSANYVYGSGFPDASPFDTDDAYSDIPYSRLDAALTYKFSAKKMRIEAGLSVMNVLNTENIKYANFVRVPTDQTSSINIHAEAVPFTPTLYLNVGF